MSEPLRWVDVNKAIMDMREEEAYEYLQREKATTGRLKLMLRLYSRFSKLRSAREKAELGRCAKG